MKVPQGELYSLGVDFDLDDVYIHMDGRRLIDEYRQIIQDTLIDTKDYGRGLAGQAIFRLELDKNDKVVNEEPLLTDLNQRIRDVRVFQDGAVYVLTDGADGKLLKLSPSNSQTRQ